MVRLRFMVVLLVAWGQANLTLRRMYASRGTVFRGAVTRCATTVGGTAPCGGCVAPAPHPCYSHDGPRARPRACSLSPQHEPECSAPGGPAAGRFASATRRALRYGSPPHRG